MGGLPGIRRDQAGWCRSGAFWHFTLVWQFTLVWPELGYRTQDSAIEAGWGAGFGDKPDF